VSEPSVSDDVSLDSASTSSRSQVNDAYRSVQDKAAEILGKKKLRYSYDIFPSEFRQELFASPRPLPAAVIAEFDRQKKDAAQFRRKKSVLQPKDKRKHIQRAHTTLDPVSSFLFSFDVSIQVANLFFDVTGNASFTRSRHVHCFFYGLYSDGRERAAGA
jgi:hypothetical protein